MDDQLAESDTASASEAFLRPSSSTAPDTPRHSRSGKSSPVNLNPDLSTGVVSGLDDLRRESVFCDVVLVVSVGGQASVSEEDTAESETEGVVSIPAHRVVLSAICPYFRAMFTGSMRESRQRRIYLKGMDGPALAQLVDYMYSGRLDIDVNNVQNLFATASILQLQWVREACTRFLLEQLDANNCLGIAEFAQVHGCAQLAHAAHLFAQQHFGQLIHSEEFAGLSEERLHALISDDHLRIGGEEVVFEALMQWVRHDESKRAAALPGLLKEVRLPLLSQDYLFDHIYPDPLVKSSADCKDQLLDACRYQRKRHDRSATTKWTTPRKPLPLSKLIMVIGGQAPKAVVNVDTFELDALRWHALADLPQRRCRCGVGMLGEYVYACGGFNGSLRVRSVDMYCPARDEWTAGSPMEARRSTLGVAVLDTQLMIAVGGFDGATGLASAEALDPRQGNWMPLPSMNVRRSSVGVAALEGLVYAVGGYDGNSRQCLNTVEIYEPRANKWRMGANLQEVRSGAGVTVANDRLVAVGGHDGPLVRSSVEILEDGVWRMLPQMSVCRRNAAVVCIGEQLVALGGDDGTLNLSSIESLNITEPNSAWSVVSAEMQPARSYSGLALLPKT